MFGGKTARQVLLSGVFVAGLAATPAEAAITIEILDPIVVAHINKSAQRMQVTIDGKPVYTWKISTGARGYSTPVGEYVPYRMHKMWRSRQYDNAPMPHSVFFHKGYAVHGTTSISRLGRRASHGCVRLHPANAKTFFDLILKHGRARTQITVSGDWPEAVKKAYERQSKRKQSGQSTN